jgi:hypothetical protein
MLCSPGGATVLFCRPSGAPPPGPPQSQGLTPLANDYRPFGAPGKPTVT